MMNKRIVLSAFLGNTLEFYNYSLFGALSFLLAPLFFPSNNPLTSLFASVTVFSMGLIARPLGGLLFGYIGDTKGRKRALVLSMSCMSIASLMIAIAPTYNQIGIFAPMILVCARLLQGISAGGEYNGAAILSLEHQALESQKFRTGLVSGILTSSAALGLLLAAIVGYIFSNPNLPSWAWRVPFFFGLLIGILGLYMRSRLSESPLFQKQSLQKDVSPSVFDIFKDNKKSMLFTFFIGGQSSLISYLLFISIPLLVKIKLPSLSAGISFLCNSLPLLAFSLSAIGAGALCRWIKAEKIMISSCIIFPFFFFAFVSQIESLNTTSLLIAHIIFGCLIGMHAGPHHALFQTLFPIYSRYRGISFGFSFGTGVLSALTTHIAFNLSSVPWDSILWIAFTSFCSAMSLFIILKKNTNSSTSSDLPKAAEERSSYDPHLKSA
jgi:MHS family proline/betaine transporter-like MFS transporter